jgi:hypothetical protein
MENPIKMMKFMISGWTSGKKTGETRGKLGGKHGENLHAQPALWGLDDVVWLHIEVVMGENHGQNPVPILGEHRFSVVNRCSSKKNVL